MTKEHDHHCDDHGHDHGHHSHGNGHGHSHSHHVGRNIGLALALNAGFAVIELIGGVLTQSMAILANAIHDLGDCIALTFAWWFERAANKRSNHRFSYGYRRLSLASAVLTALFLVVAATFILSQAIPRLLHPVYPKVNGMALLALLGVAINGFAAWRLNQGSTMNERVLSWHLLEDFLGWLAVLIISIVMKFVDAPILDPLLCVVFTTFILFGVLRSLRQTIHLFLQGAPRDIDLTRMKQEISVLPGVCGIHDVHLWSLDGESHVMTLHAVVGPDINLAAAERIKGAIRATAKKHGRLHVTIELEPTGTDCVDQFCNDESSGAPT